MPARGDAVPGSDADLRVVLSHADRRDLDQLIRYLPPPCGIGVDVFPYTHAEPDARLRATLRWAVDVGAGITLYERALLAGDPLSDSSSLIREVPCLPPPGTRNPER